MRSAAWHLGAPETAHAGFDAVRLLDADAEYLRAFELATHLHATTGRPFDVDGLLADAHAQLALVERGTRWFEPRAAPVSGVAAVLPGAVCLRIERDARDTAISMFLSDFHPQSFGWTCSLEPIRRVLARMGPPMDEDTLAPEANARTVLTLSHEQVRRSINRGSIGRWKNYEWAFDSAWHGA